MACLQSASATDAAELLSETDGVGQVVLFESFLGRRESTKFFNTMTSWESTTLKNEEVRMFGKTSVHGRKTAHYGDPGVSYAYAGKRHPCNGFSNSVIGRELDALRRRVNAKIGSKFNYVLVNHYRPEDKLGFHADDEADMVAGAPIAGLNFGATRDLVFQPKTASASASKVGRGSDSGVPKKFVVRKTPGSLYVMKSPLQNHWKHGVPQRKRVVGNHTSLTFRQLIVRKRE